MTTLVSGCAASAVCKQRTNNKAIAHAPVFIWFSPPYLNDQRVDKWFRRVNFLGSLSRLPIP